MEYIIGILLLISFVGLAVYAVRGGNLMMGMLIMGVIWTVLPLIGNTFATNPDFIAAYPGVTDISFVDAITKVFQSGPEGWGKRTCKCCVRRMVWTCAVRDWNCGCIDSKSRRALAEINRLLYVCFCQQ